MAKEAGDRHIRSGAHVRVAVVHGYFLHDSGSGVYVRELTRALVRLGHEVTLVCQDREPERCGFIDSMYTLDARNQVLTLAYEAPRVMAGSCRLVRPDLGGELLVYAVGAFPPFARERVHAFQDSPVEMRDRYVASNVAALRTVFAKWLPELTLAQHLIMQPYEVARALAGRAPYVVTEHGSALNFSVRACEELVPFALAGLEGATSIASVSDGARDDLIAWAGEKGLPIADKTVAMPPGIDGDLFAPADGREAALVALSERVDLPSGFELTAGDDIVVFAGSLRPTKGIQHAIAALPLISHMRGRPARLLVAGDGPAREPLEELARLVGSGDLQAARRLVDGEPRLQSPPLWGEVVPDESAVPGGGGAEGGRTDGSSVAFLGHLEHDQLAAAYAAADLCVAPSVFPEAAALVNVEGLSAGAAPVAAYHSGMVDLDDLLARALHDSTFTGLVPGPDFTRRLAELVVHVLDTYPTKDAGFRRRLHELAASRYPTWEGTARQYVAMAPR
jgi:glycosyltransferase involved in cell wall biosynthesis